VRANKTRRGESEREASHRAYARPTGRAYNVCFVRAVSTTYLVFDVFANAFATGESFCIGVIDVLRRANDHVRGQDVNLLHSRDTRGESIERCSSVLRVHIDFVKYFTDESNVVLMWVFYGAHNR